MKAPFGDSEHDLIQATLQQFMTESSFSGLNSGQCIGHDETIYGLSNKISNVFLLVLT